MKISMWWRVLHPAAIRSAYRYWGLDRPMAWNEFNRMCWRVYGTGRTKPDEVNE